MLASWYCSATSGTNISLTQLNCRTIRKLPIFQPCVGKEMLTRGASNGGVTCDMNPNVFFFKVLGEICRGRRKENLNREDFRTYTWSYDDRWTAQSGWVQPSTYH